MGSSELTGGVDLASFAISMELLMANSVSEEDDISPEHYFADGVYVRKLTIPKGTVIIGKKHRYSCVNIMVSGDITIFADGESERYSGHYIGVAPAGTQKAARAHEDTVWITVNAASSDNLEEIEKDIVIEDDETNKILTQIRNHKGLS